jgi:hypothetical protein
MKMFFLIQLLFFGFCINAQNPLNYYTRFGGESDDVGNCIIQTLNGGYAIVGQTNSFWALQNDIYISRTNNLAQPIWQKNIGGSLSDIGKSLVELSDSSFVITGYTNSYGNGGYDAYIVKTDKDGNVIWQKTFGGSDWDFAYSINKTSDGNLIICGTTYSFGHGGKDGFILKMDYAGNIIWSKIYGGLKDDYLKEIIQTNDGGFIAAGTTMSYGDSLGDIWVTKFNSNGDSTWFITRGGIKKDVGNSIVQDINGNYLVAGGSESFTNGMEDAYFFKLSNSNSFIWDRFEGFPNKNEESFSIKNSTSNLGKMIICYSTKEIDWFGIDAKTLLLDGNGYYIDGGRVGSSGDDELFCIANTNDKGYILVGYTNGFNNQVSSQTDIFVLKFDSIMNPGSFFVGTKNILPPNDIFIKTYPNPFDDYLTINIGGNQILKSIEILDINGIVVYSQVGIKENIINIRDIKFPEGIYFLKVVTNSNTYINKLFCRN